MFAAALVDHGVADKGAQSTAHPLGPDAFEAQALETLTALRPVIADEVMPVLPELAGTWHPTGFMVFRLGQHSMLGSLRLHIWPKGLRRREAKGRGDLGPVHDGDIHDHAWGVASAVLADYHDALYDVAAAPRREGELPVDEFRVFTVGYGARAHNALVTDGTCVTAVARERRHVRAGDVHVITAGDFHAPTVPDDALGATLVYSGPRTLEQGPHVLIGGSTDPIVGHRLEITAADAILARDQLREAL